jgi:membrane fusion protein, copper/silver efflux system
VKRLVALAAAVVLAAAAGAVGGYWVAEHNLLESWFAAGQKPDGHAQPAAAPVTGEPASDSIPSSAASADRGKILYYRNPMGQPDTSPVPKKDPMGMDYVPVYASDVEAAGQGLVRIAPERLQMIGVQSEPVLHRSLVRPIRAVATVQFDERRTYVVSTRYEGWIEKLLVNTTGEKVRRGQPLMQVYSPDLVLAQQEYALLRRSLQEVDSAAGGSASASRQLMEGAERRLRSLDFPVAELERLLRGGEPRATVSVPSPVSGTVIDKPALQGMRFMPGEPLYTIVDMSTVWLIADVFEQDLGDVRIGQDATIALKAYPARTFKGRVAFLYPSVGSQTRTARVRIAIPNPDDLLKAEMYAEVDIAAPLGQRSVLAVPESAVLDTGTRRVVLVEHGQGRFEPRDVKLGGRAGGYVEVEDGVKAGERVVVSANFLIDAESNLKAALGGFAGAEHQHQ